MRSAMHGRAKVRKCKNVTIGVNAFPHLNIFIVLMYEMNRSLYLIAQTHKFVVVVCLLFVNPFAYIIVCLLDPFVCMLLFLLLSGSPRYYCLFCLFTDVLP